MRPRIIKVSELMKQQVSKLILSDVNVPQGALLTVVAAKVSVDLRYADIIISVFPTEKIEEVLSVLDEGIYDMQQKINKKLSMRPVPKIRFRVDTSAEYVQKIETLIRQSKNE